MGVTRFLPAVCFVLLLAGCQSDPGFPEDQTIDGPFHIDSEWHVIQLDAPLKVNREGLQRLHLVVDRDLYDPNNNFDDDLPDLFNLRRSDGVLVKPEVVLIGDEGQEVSLRARANTYLYSGGVTVGLSTYKDHYSQAPPFPESIRFFRAIRIRSNEPLVAEQLQWRVDRHPDHHRCGNRRCTWWDNLFN